MLWFLVQGCDTRRWRPETQSPGVQLQHLPEHEAPVDDVIVASSLPIYYNLGPDFAEF